VRECVCVWWWCVGGKKTWVAGKQQGRGDGKRETIESCVCGRVWNGGGGGV
jgi:hypothetical protein